MERIKYINHRKRRLAAAISIALILLVIAFFNTMVNFITDYWWFKDLGYTEVFFKKLFTELKIGIPLFIFLGIITEIYLLTIKRNYLKKLEFSEGNASIKSMNRFTALISAVFSGIMTVFMTTRIWQEVLYSINSTSFGKVDPLFGKDISFYVFKMALIKTGSSLGMTLVMGFFVITALYFLYLISVRRPDIIDEVNLEDDEKVINTPFGPIKAHRTESHLDTKNISQLAMVAVRQLVITGVFFCIMLAAIFFIKQYDLLYSDNGVVVGAGYTDIHITLLLYRVEFVLAIASAIALVVFARKKQYRRILMLPALMIVISLAFSGIGMAVQSLIVSGDEQDKETPYLKSNIEFTQKAYDIDKVKDMTFKADAPLTAENIKANDGTISNIRINDFDPSKQFYNQTQSLRTYYKFNDVDVDRYILDGKYTQTFLSAREMESSNLGDVSWLTKHLIYTHGYGVTLSQVDAITSTGQPEMLIYNIPPASSTEDLKITTPEIYFGESTNEYIITNTHEKEFDYPNSDGNVYTKYEGKNGVKLNMFKRLLYAIKESNIRILVSSNINSDSKILYERNIMQRVNKIAPFLTYDTDPYITISDSGKLYWIIDAYTTTNSYPYSESTKLSEYTSFNYIRNPIKVVIDAYTGETNFYKVTDEPIVSTISKIYPHLIKDISEIPDGLGSHIRYSNTYFNIQAKMYQRYHMSVVDDFYKNEDKWSIATEVYGQDEKNMTPNYYIMKLPGEQHEEFISSIPYTPNSKRNMTGLLVARSDGDAYGDLILYRMPKDKVIYGPMQIESQIDQNTEISKEFSLWNSSGSKYSRGDMFVIPIDDALLYVEPVYLESSNDTSLPEVKRVIVAFNDRIAYAPTLAEALDELFNMGDEYVDENTASAGETNGDAQSGETTSGETLSLTELASRANEAYNNAVKAQQSGDWAAYGRYLNELQGYLQRMNDEATDNAAASSAE
ncbi:MAG: UPF0182 family membrane protein [Anaerovoracaceae bacterium]